MKHAFLIIAHHEFDVLRHLIEALDDERNDVYIHFDKKVDSLPVIQLYKAGLYILENRVDVRWGDVSQIESEFVLFQEAYSNGPYLYYHTLSGVDMPLKSMDTIHTFFNKYHGKELIGFHQENIRAQVDRKVRKYHVFPRYFRVKNPLLSFFFRSARFISIRLQYLLRVARHKDVEFKKGTSWVSVTHEFVTFFLPKRDDMIKMYRYTFCADEIFLQTLCWDSKFRHRLYDSENEGRGCMREVEWENGEVKDWTIDDYEKLKDSEAFFARKFSSKNIEVVKKILTNVTKR